MSFREPLLLLALALLPLAIAAYVLAQRRRKKFALRYTNLEVLATVSGRSWGRHIPAAFALLALTALLIALGRPERTVAAPQRQGAVIMVTDTSGSMEATDVHPTRLAAAQEAARALTKKLPEEFNLGLVTFNNGAESLVAPTTDRNQVYAAIQGLKVHGSTAMGDGLELGLQTRAHADQRQRRQGAAAAGPHRAAVRRQERAREGAGRRSPTRRRSSRSRSTRSRSAPSRARSTARPSRCPCRPTT